MTCLTTDQREREREREREEKGGKEGVECCVLGPFFFKKGSMFQFLVLCL